VGLRLKVGHATRSVDECLRHAKSDLTIRTALLEARYIWGEQALFAELQRASTTEIVAAPRASSSSKAGRARRPPPALGDSRYVLEPNIKEGKGGLRDLHTLFWIAKYIYRIDDVAELVELGVLSEEAASSPAPRNSCGRCAAICII
jgi:[protein-PII] uridylyltransferase